MHVKITVPALICVVNVFALLIFNWGCSAQSDDTKPQQATGGKPVIQFEGKVKYIPLEGGFWGLIANDGKKYNPVTLPKQFHVEDLPVRVKAELMHGMVGIHMWGQIIRVTEIEGTGVRK